jgi:hypothetical protein
MKVRFLSALSVVLIGLLVLATDNKVSAQDSAWRPVGSPRSNVRTAALDRNRKGSHQAPPFSSENKPSVARVSVARVTKGTDSLPNKHGQVWREYDISSYTVRVTSTKRPEQAIIDWILLETGYEAWHGEPLGILSATPRKLRVYHTPTMQKTVAAVVDRFVANQGKSTAFSLRVLTVDQPNWRSKVHKLMRPVDVRTPGVNAWLLQKEDAALLLSGLQRRSDYRVHSSPHMLVNNGQSTVVSATRQRTYTKDVTIQADVWPGYEIQQGRIDEGFSLEFAPLLSVDKGDIDAVVKCNIDQVERMIPVMIDVPTEVSPRQRTKIEVPQLIHLRFQERFRWPAGQVLLIEMGMVPLPVPVDAKPLIPGLGMPLGTTPRRADLLVMIEAKGTSVAKAPRGSRTPKRTAGRYRARY